MKTCIACGMPMEEAKDFALGDMSKDYCTYCADADGAMKSFEEAKRSMIHFVTSTQGIDPAMAEKVAINAMKKLPAWENQFEN